MLKGSKSQSLTTKQKSGRKGIVQRKSFETDNSLIEITKGGVMLRCSLVFSVTSWTRTNSSGFEKRYNKRENI